MRTDDSIDADVRLQVYRFFVDRGRPPVPAEIAQALGAEQRAVEDALRRLADQHVLVLAAGTPYVWMANPFSAIPTPFSVDAASGAWYGSCIWDALGIVALIGGAGTVRTWCADCGEPLAVAVDGGRLTSGDGVAHFTVPAAQWWEDIGFT